MELSKYLAIYVIDFGFSTFFGNILFSNQKAWKFYFFLYVEKKFLNEYHEIQ